MVSRGIDDSCVDHVLMHPRMIQDDPQDPELQHFLAPIAECEHRVLRVVAKRDTIPVLVITAFFDRTMRGKI